MRRVLCALAAICLLAWSVSDAAAQTMGIYFDQAGTSPAWGDSSTTYPCSVQAYLVAKGIDPANGIQGWECSITWSQNLFVSVGEIFGQPVNVGTPPSFIVGLASPIGIGSTSVALARLNVVALGAGELRLGASTPCSIPNSQLPIAILGQTLSPLALEYGQPGSACATLGADAAPLLLGGTVQCRSQFEQIEYRDGYMYGYAGADKSWVRLPRFASADEVVLSQQECALLALAPSMSDHDEALANKSTALLSDNFEGYTANTAAHSLFSRQYPNTAPPFFSTSSNDGAYDGFENFWGVTNARSAPGGGIKSAYCNAIARTCTVWPDDYSGTPGVGCQDQYNSNHTIVWGSHNQLVSPTFILPSYQAGELRASILNNMYGNSDYPESNDHVVIGLYSNSYWYPLGVVWWNSPSQWSSIRIPFTSDVPHNVDLSAYFIFRAEGNGTVEGNWSGVYVDNVEIRSVDTNLKIESATAPTSTSATTPVSVTLRIRNDGSDDSGSFKIAYSRGDWGHFDAAAMVASQTVASIAGYGYSDVTVAVPYRDPNSKVFQPVTEWINFKIDWTSAWPGDYVTETNEQDNETSVQATWQVFNPPVILVHGIMGGALEKDNEQVWGEDLNKSFRRLLWSTTLARTDDTNGEADQQTMSLPSAYPPANGFLRDPAATLDVTINTGVIGNGLSYPLSIPLMDYRNLWKPLIDRLVGAQYWLPAQDPGNPSATQDVYLFNYDWRVDLNPTRSTYLAGSAYARFEDLVTKIRATHPGADRLTVVSHSMGGLVVQAYMRAKGDHGIKRWISIGTPFEGSESAMATLFGANGFEFPVAGATVGEKVANITKNYVSAWECLPTPHADNEEQNAPWWYGLRIPVISATHSDRFRPRSPVHFGHLFRRIPATAGA